MTDTKSGDTKRITLQCQFCSAWNRVNPARAADRPKCGSCGRPMLLDRPYPLTDDSFQRTLNETDIPIMVDFYADWCGPCKIMAPYIDAIAAKYQGTALVAKLNTDYNQATAKAHQIQGIPTTIIFDKGRIAARQSGALPQAALEGMLAEVLDNDGGPTREPAAAPSSPGSPEPGPRLGAERS